VRFHADGTQYRRRNLFSALTQIGLLIKAGPYTGTLVVAETAESAAHVFFRVGFKY
jgi:hypothetical protein